MKPELKDIEFDEPYVIDEFNNPGRTFMDQNADNDLDEIKLDTEDTDYLVQMKIKIYMQKIDREDSIKNMMINGQKHNVHKIGAYALFMIIFSLIIIIIEKSVGITNYTRIKDVSIFDMASVGALMIYPTVFLLALGIIVSMVWIIVLLKRCVVTEDPHDRTYRRREYIIKKCNDRMKSYNDEVYRLQMKLLHMK